MVGSSIGIMQNRDAQRVCTAAGVATTKGKLTEMYKVRDSLRISINEADQALDDAKFADKLLLSAQLIKGICDGAIGVLGEISGPLGKTIKEGYKTTSGVATDVSRHVAGEKVNFVATAANAGFGAISTSSAFAKAKSSAIGGDFRNSKEIGDHLVNRTKDRTVAAFEKKFWSGGVTSAKMDTARETADSLKQVSMGAKALKIPSDAIIEAVDADANNREPKKEVFAKMMVDLGGIVADGATEMSGAKIPTGSDRYVKLGGAYSATKDLISAGMAITGAIQDYRKNSAADSVGAARKSLVAQIKGIDGKIATLEKALLDCAPPPSRLG